MKTTQTCFEVVSSRNPNVAVVRIYTQSENLRKLHDEMIWMCIIDIKYYHFNRVKIIFRKNNFLLQILQLEWRLPPVLSKSRHTLKMMVSGLFVEFEITVNHICNIILNIVTMRT